MSAPPEATQTGGRRPVILDCDPGHDDALAILLAARHFDVLGITTVAGNVDVDGTTLNARRIVDLAGLDVPIARGCAFPLVQPPVHAPEIHGQSGLDGYQFLRLGPSWTSATLWSCWSTRSAPGTESRSSRPDP